MISSTIKRFFREPLLHFVLIGFLLFIVYDLKQGLLEEAPNRIVVSVNQIEQLLAQFKQAKHRLPAVSERAALIDN